MGNYKECKSLPIFLARADGGIESITRNEDGNILTRTIYRDCGTLRSVYEYNEDGVLRKVTEGNKSFTVYPNSNMDEEFNEYGQLVAKYNADASLRFIYRYSNEGELEQKLYSNEVLAEDYYYGGATHHIYDKQGRMVAEFDTGGNKQAIYEYYENGTVQYEHKYDKHYHSFRREFDKDGVPVYDRDTGGRLLAIYKEGKVKDRISYRRRSRVSSISEIFFYDGDSELPNSRMERGVKENKDKTYLYDANGDLKEEMDTNMDNILQHLTKAYEIPSYHPALSRYKKPS